MEGGIGQGRRENPTGGGLIRSVGGWAEVKQLKRQGHEHVMGDERILGYSAFVENLLSQADEAYERRYELKRLGYDADRIAKRVAGIYDMDPCEFLSKGKQQLKVTARRLEISPPTVGDSVERGEVISRENGYRRIY